MEYVTVKTFCDSMELTPEESKYILNYVNGRTGGERCDFSTSVSLLELVDALDDLKKSDVYGLDYVDPNDPGDAWNPSKGLYPKQYEMNMQWSSRKRVKENFDEEYGEDIDNMHKVKELFKQELWHPTENHSKQMKQAMAYVVHFIRESEQRKKRRV